MPRRSAEPRYRRRVVLELTPDESDLLDRLADRHGTIRGAVLVGLRELEADRSAALEAQVRDLTQQLAAAERSAADEHDRLAAELAAATEQVATSRKELKAAQAERKAVREDLREARAKLSHARGAAQTQQRALEARLVRVAFCGACGKFVPDSEWAEQAGQGGFIIPAGRLPAETRGAWPAGYRPRLATVQHRRRNTVSIPSPARPIDLSGLAPILQIFLVLFLVLAFGRRTKLIGGIRLAPPTFVPLASDAASRFAHELGTAFADLVEAEQRREKT